jgi:hypothetical protein
LEKLTSLYTDDTCVRREREIQKSHFYATSAVPVAYFPDLFTTPSNARISKYLRVPPQAKCPYSVIEMNVQPTHVVHRHDSHILNE